MRDVRDVMLLYRRRSGAVVFIYLHDAEHLDAAVHRQCNSGKSRIPKRGIVKANSNMEIIGEREELQISGMSGIQKPWEFATDAQRDAMLQTYSELKHVYELCMHNTLMQQLCPAHSQSQDRYEH